MFPQFEHPLWQIWASAGTLVFAILAALGLLVLIGDMAKRAVKKEREKERQLEEIALAYRHQKRSH